MIVLGLVIKLIFLMKDIYRKLCIPVLLYLFLFNPVFADNMTVSPAIIEKNVNPGVSYNFSVNITNNDNQTEDLFYADVHNIKNVTEFGEPVFSDEIGEKTDFEMASWIKVSSDGIKIKAGQTRSLTFSIMVPKDATPGWHAAAIFVGNNPAKVDGSNISSISYRTAVVISFRVSGTVLDDLQINKFGADGYVFFGPNVNFEVRLQNIGNALERPIGTIEITDFNGEKVANIDINENRSAVVPGNLKTLNTSWKGDRWLFGRYKAALALSYGSENSYKTAARQTYFWILPGKIIWTSVGGLILLALLVFVFVKIYIRKKIESITSTKSAVKTVGRVSKLVIMTLVSLAFSIIFFVVLFILFS